MANARGLEESWTMRLRISVVDTLMCGATSACSEYKKFPTAIVYANKGLDEAEENGPDSGNVKTFE